MAEKERLSRRSERPSNEGQSLSRPGDGANAPGRGRTGASDRLICAASDLAEGGDGVRFEIERNGETIPAFAIRHGGRVYAYLNRCAHIAMELDWMAGKFFDGDGAYLICSTHGALYAPESGACRGGPCRGAALSRLNVFEADGKVYLTKD